MKNNQCDNIMLTFRYDFIVNVEYVTRNCHFDYETSINEPVGDSNCEIKPGKTCIKYYCWYNAEALTSKFGVYNN